uniref:Ubiquitin-like protease family profile domain-containing protein n=1 Tax=Daucus carota subsp. sativus TaxID=79200 RepID=A0A164YJH4_DAUCS
MATTPVGSTRRSPRLQQLQQDPEKNENQTTATATEKEENVVRKKIYKKSNNKIKETAGRPSTPPSQQESEESEEISVQDEENNDQESEEIFVQDEENNDQESEEESSSQDMENDDQESEEETSVQDQQEHDEENNEEEVTTQDHETESQDKQDFQEEDMMNNVTKKRKFSRKLYVNENEKVEKKRKFGYKKPRKPIDEEKVAAIAARKLNTTARIRNSPRLLTEMLFFLTEDQKNWVKKSAFRNLLDFKLEMLPSKIASKVLQSFDHYSVSLEIKSGKIDITEKEVFNVLGIPCGGKPVEEVFNDITKKRMEDWLAQFPNEQITTRQVLDKVRKAPVTDVFKIHFLRVVSEVLFGTSTHSYVTKYLVNFEDLDKTVNYNWAELLMKHLVNAKESWLCTESDFFRGPLVFLTLLYVDRVRHKGLKLVERKFPTYSGWTDELLRERQTMEDNDEWDDHVAWQEVDDLEKKWKASRQQATNKENLQQNENDCYDKDDWDYADIQENMENETEDDTIKTEQELIENLKSRAQDILDLKFSFDDDMLKARKQFPDSQTLKTIEEVFKENFLFQEEDNSTSEEEDVEDDSPTDNHEDRNNSNENIGNDIQNEKVNNDVEKEDVQNRDGEKKDAEMEDVQQEKIQKMDGENKDAEMENVEKTDAMNKDTEMENVQKENFEKDRDARTKVAEMANVEEAIVQEDNTVNQTNEDSRYCPSFSLGIEEEIDGDFMTPEEQKRAKSKRTKKIGQYAKSPYMDRVIDIKSKLTSNDYALWSFTVQDKDLLEVVYNWKGIQCMKEQMQTLLPRTSVYYSVIDSWTTILNDNEKYKSEESPMRLFCTMADLIFFPIHKAEHYYLITYDLKNLACFLIDNIEREGNPKPYYGKTPEVLISQTKQIKKLRIKYNTAILSSSLNEFAAPIMEYAQKLLASNKVFRSTIEEPTPIEEPKPVEEHRVAETSTSRQNEKPDSAKKTVQFATNLITVFNEEANTKNGDPSV